MYRTASFHRLAGTAAAAAAALLLAVGCGGDDGESATPSTTEPTTSAPATSAPSTTVATAVSTEAFVAAGNEVCDRVGADVQAAFPDFEGEPTIEQAKQLGADLAPIFQDFRDSIAALDAPADLDDQRDALLVEVDAAVAGLKGMTTDEGAAAAIAAGGPPIDAATQAAHELFDRCPA